MRQVNAWIALVLLLLAGCASPQRVARQGDHADIPDALSQVLRDYEAAWRAKDSAALAALFAEDGYILPNTKLPVRGRDNIRKAYEGAGGHLYLTPLTWAMSGDIAWVIGTYTHDPTVPAEEGGKFTLTLKRDNDPTSPSHGAWLIFSDMDNPNRRK